MAALPRNDGDVWRLIQPIIAEGWDSKGLVADRVVMELEIEDDTQAEEMRARVERVLIERTLNMTGG